MFVVVKKVLKFAWKTKKWWLIPFILGLIIVILLLLAQTVSPVPIFIYPLV